MTPITRPLVLKMPERECYCEQGVSCESCRALSEVKSMNKEVEVCVDREMLARELHKLQQQDKHLDARMEWDDKNLSKNYYYEKADYLIANPTWLSMKIGKEK